MAIEEKILAGLRAQHGNRLYVVSRGDHDFAFRRPSGAEYRKYSVTVLEDPKSRYDALEALTKSCFVHPSPSELATVLDDYPALVNDLGGEALLTCQLDGNDRAKKA